MTQYARPNGDVSATNWTDSYTAIDEVSPSDTDYIIGSNSANGTFICTLNSISEPATKNACTIKFRARKSASGGHDRQVSVQVFEGTTARGTAVASGNLSETWTEYSSTSIDLSAVTDWGALRFNIVSAGTTGTPAGDRRYVWVSWGELSTPDAGGTNVKSNKAAFLKGKIDAASRAVSFLSGSISAKSRAASFISGLSGSRSRQISYLKGLVNTKQKISAYVKGVISSKTSNTAFLHGKINDRSRSAVFTKGSINAKANKSAYLSGYSAGTNIKASTKAFLLGLENIVKPDSDVASVGSWSNQSGGGTNLYQSIDEDHPGNDADYIRNTNVSDGDYYECSLQNPVGTPGDGAVVVLWRAKDNTGGGHVQATAQLRQGSSTVISSMQTILSATMTTYYMQLTPAEKASITDWNDLRIRVALSIV
jgi:hypothetical protein